MTKSLIAKSLLVLLVALLGIPLAHASKDPSFDGLSRFVFPEDVKIKPAGDKTEFSVGPEAEAVHSTISLSKDQAGDAKKTLKLALDKGALVDLGNGSSPIQIPIYRIAPQNLVVLKKGGSGMVFKDWPIELRTKDTNTLIGISCQGCSTGDQSDVYLIYQAQLNQALSSNNVVEINLTREADKVVSTTFKDKLFDPRSVFFQPFYFENHPGSPGGFQIGSLPNLPNQNEKRASTETPPDQTISQIAKGPLYNGENILFHPTFPVGSSAGQISYEPISSFGKQDFAPIVVIDGISHILGDAGLFLSYHHVFVTLTRIVSKAVVQKKKIALHTDRINSLDEAITVSDESFDPNTVTTTQQLSEKSNEVQVKAAMGFGESNLASELSKLSTSTSTSDDAVKRFFAQVVPYLKKEKIVIIDSHADVSTQGSLMAQSPEQKCYNTLGSGKVAFLKDAPPNEEDICLNFSLFKTLPPDKLNGHVIAWVSLGIAKRHNFGAEEASSIGKFILSNEK